MRRILKQSLLFLLVACPLAASIPSDSSGVPWDSIMAEIKVIEALQHSDSVKYRELRHLFAAYEVGAEDYRRFYDNLMTAPFEDQRAFMEQVKIILKGMLAANRLRPHRTRNETPPPDKR